MAEGGGSIEINTTHEHYTDFEIDGVAFRRYGDLVFKDGDNVRLYAYKSSSGYYQVGLIKNFTRDFYVGPKPQKPTQDDDKDNDKNQKKSVFQIIGTIIVAMMMGIFYGFLPALVISFVVTVIGVIFFDVDNIEFIDKLGLFLGMDRFFDLLFMAVVFLAIIGGFAIICAIGAIISLLPESESAKQARKQREAEQKQQAEAQWTIYQKVVNDEQILGFAFGFCAIRVAILAMTKPTLSF